MTEAKARAVQVTILVARGKVLTADGPAVDPSPQALLEAAKSASEWIHDQTSYDLGLKDLARGKEIGDALAIAVAQYEWSLTPVQIVVRGSLACSERCPWLRDPYCKLFSVLLKVSPNGKVRCNECRAAGRLG